jgi:hypothetical protein
MDREVDILERDQRLGFTLLGTADFIDTPKLAGFDGIF